MICVPVVNNDRSITIKQAEEEESDEADQLDMEQTANGYRINTPFRPFSLTGSYVGLNLTIRDAAGLPVMGAKVDIDFEQVRGMPGEFPQRAFCCRPDVFGLATGTRSSVRTLLGSAHTPLGMLQASNSL